MTKRIFVYGSLRCGQSAHGYLEKRSCFVKETRLPGFDLYALTWFPGIVENPDNKEGVVGDVFEGITDDLVTYLDYYEGYYPHDEGRSLFLRKEVNVDGEPTIVYVFNKNPYDVFGTSVRVIQDGDWVKYKGDMQHAA